MNQDKTVSNDDKVPETLSELCDYIVRNADRIFVREQIKGKWGSYSLTELPANLAIKHALNFIREGRIPYRIKQDKEQTKK